MSAVTVKRPKQLQSPHTLLLHPPVPPLHHFPLWLPSTSKTVCGTVSAVLAERLMLPYFYGLILCEHPTVNLESHQLLSFHFSPVIFHLALFCCVHTYTSARLWSLLPSLLFHIEPQIVQSPFSRNVGRAVFRHKCRKTCCGEGCPRAFFWYSPKRFKREWRTEWFPWSPAGTSFQLDHPAV